MLREIPLTSGTMTARGTLSYASQEPWLFAGSVRQNILFGMPYDRQRYKEVTYKTVSCNLLIEEFSLQVIDVCALKPDFDLFPFGDRTIVGERGTSLSGGQRARINLAR